MQAFGPLGNTLLLHLSALPDRRHAVGDFVADQRLLPGAQAIGLALRAGRFV